MRRLFIDSSVLYSAAYSPHGHSRDLLHMGLRGEVQLVISQFVLIETRRNLESQARELALLFDFVAENTPFELVETTKRQVLAASRRVALKDAPIVAAAKKAKVDFLVTLDKKHLLGKPSLTKFVGARIVTPKEVVTALARN